jgi:hypothetical protein
MTKRTKICLAVAVFMVACVASGYASDGDDLDNYRWRVEGNWWFAHPSGHFGLQSGNNYFDINRDFGFGNYSTFTGKVDWRFGHKHHFLLNVTPNNNSRTVILSREIVFEGQTFPVNARVTASVNKLNIAPGYQYDIIRRDHGFLGLEVDFNLVRTTGKLSAAANVGSVGAAFSASNTLWAPLPAVGPVFRWYPLHDSNRLSVEGSARGMPFFGYGNFVASRANVNVGLNKHLALRAGYEMGSRLSIHGTSDQIAVRLTDRGPTAGLEYSFGEAPPKREHIASTQPGNWHVDWIPLYLWFSGLKGNLGAGGYVAPVDASFSDIFKQLNIGLMTSLDMRRKRVGVFTDLIFMSLSSDQKTTPIGGGAYSGFTANAKQLIVDPELYVRLLDSSRGSVDAIGGGRFWHLNNSLDLLPGTLAGATAGQTQNWVDPVLGARFRLNLNKGWFAELKGDAGGFGVGSQSTWQINSAVGKEFKKRYSLRLGYRYMSVDYTNGAFLYDVHMSGLVAGFGIRLK